MVQEAILGGGCFWCIEAVFRQIKGVYDVQCGYSGGKASTATYQMICHGRTGHAEVVKILFDEKQIDYDQLLTIFFTVHDATTLNRQGNDIGTQYRSVIFYLNETQQKLAELKIQALKDMGLDIVTEVSPMVDFYRAEEYHQNFYAKNTHHGYCNAMIPPKLAKLQQHFKDLLI